MWKWFASIPSTFEFRYVFFRSQLSNKYIFFERNNYRKIHGLQVCLVLWSCVCFWELPRLKFERVESKGDFISLSWLRFAQHEFSFASLLTGSTWVLLTLELQTGENIYNFTGCLCRHHFYTMDFFFPSLFLRNTFTKIPYHCVVVVIETKFRNLRGNSGAMENHVYTKDFFFVSLISSPS